MKRFGLISAMLALIVTFVLSGCATAPNTNGNPEVGKQAGAVVNGRAFVHEMPEAARRIQEAEIHPSNRPMNDIYDLDQKEFLSNCQSTCNPDKNNPNKTAFFCQNYCSCTYGQMASRVSAIDLRAFARNERTTATPVINSIIHECSARAAKEEQIGKQAVNDPNAPVTVGNSEADQRQHSTSGY